MEPNLPKPTPPPEHIYPEPSRQSSQKHKNHREGLKSILSTLGLLILAPILAIILTNFVFHSYEVYGESMEPTMHNGDRLFVLKAPATWAHVTGQEFMPQRGQVIIFNKNDLATNGDETKQLVKRVIGLPGDRVVVANERITIYNTEHPDGYAVDENTDYGDSIPPTEGDVDITVNSGEVFVAGDNRQNSLDSRYFGPIRTSDIIGTAEFRMYPFKNTRSF